MNKLIKAAKIFGFVFAIEIIGLIIYGLKTDIPNTAIYVPSEKALRL